ncbi:hypothetical protein CsSME_00044133 [Camellia sinensis var. sinensis]
MCGEVQIVEQLLVGKVMGLMGNLQDKSHTKWVFLSAEGGLKVMIQRAKSDDGYVASCRGSHSTGKIEDLMELESLEIREAVAAIMQQQLQTWRIMGSWAREVRTAIKPEICREMRIINNLTTHSF